MMFIATPIRSVAAARKAISVTLRQLCGCLDMDVLGGGGGTGLDRGHEITFFAASGSTKGLSVTGCLREDQVIMTIWGAGALNTR